MACMFMLGCSYVGVSLASDDRTAHRAYTLPAKNMEYISFQRIVVFCGVCKVFLYLIYIPTSRYYFWGVNSHPIAK